MPSTTTFHTTMIKKPDVPLSVMSVTYSGANNASLKSKNSFSSDFHELVKQQSNDLERQTVASETDRIKEKAHSHKKKRKSHLYEDIIDKIYSKYTSKKEYEQARDAKHDASTPKQTGERPRYYDKKASKKKLAKQQEKKLAEQKMMEMLNKKHSKGFYMEKGFADKSGRGDDFLRDGKKTLAETTFSSKRFSREEEGLGVFARENSRDSRQSSFASQSLLRRHRKGRAEDTLDEPSHARKETFFVHNSRKQKRVSFHKNTGARTDPLSEERTEAKRRRPFAQDNIKVTIKSDVLHAYLGRDAGRYKKPMQLGEARNLLAQAYAQKHNGRQMSDYEFVQFLKPTAKKTSKLGFYTYHKERLFVDDVVGLKAKERNMERAKWNIRNGIRLSAKDALRDKLDSQKEYDMEQGSFGQAGIADTIDTLQRLKTNTDRTIKGGRTVLRFGKDVKELAVNSTRVVANLKVDASAKKDGKAKISDGKTKAENVFDRKQNSRKSTKQYRKEAVQKSKEATKQLAKKSRDKQIEKAMAKKVTTNAVANTKISAVVLNVLKTIVSGIAGFLSSFSAVIVILLIILLILLFIAFMAFFPIFLALSDIRSMTQTNTYLEQWETDWNDYYFSEDAGSLIDFYTQPLTFGYFVGGAYIDEDFLMENYGEIPENTCTINVLCDGEPAVCDNNFINYYALLLTQYNFETLNMGASLGGDYINGYPDEPEMAEFLKDVFDAMYPADETSPYVEITQSSVLYNLEDEYGNSFVVAEAVDTQINIHVLSMSDIMEQLGYTDKQVSLYNTVRRTLERAFQNPDKLSENGAFDVSFLVDSSASRSTFDQMNAQELASFMESAPTSLYSREYFADMVYGYCNPSQFQYLYGGKDPSTGKLDCSGFVAYMLKLNGIEDYGTSTATLWEHSYAISPAQARKGDLVFKQTPQDNGINHVGIYMGNSYEDGKFCHCTSGLGSVCNSYQGFVYYRRLAYNFNGESP